MKTRKPIKYRYIDSLYEYTLDIIFTNDVKRSLKSLYKQWNISEEVHDCEGCTVICQGKEDKYQDISKSMINTTNFITKFFFFRFFVI